VEKALRLDQPAARFKTAPGTSRSR
jgi:hypothetical protein